MSRDEVSPPSKYNLLVPPRRSMYLEDDRP
jgi:hypothetical protein